MKNILLKGILNCKERCDMEKKLNTALCDRVNLSFADMDIHREESELSISCNNDVTNLPIGVSHSQNLQERKLYLRLLRKLNLLEFSSISLTFLLHVFI